MKVRSILLLAAAAVLTACVTMSGPEDKVKVLIINGQNNHDWEATTAVLKATLQATNRFDVTTSTSPPANSAKELWDKWRPQFSKYQALVVDYNGDMWPEQVKADFVRFVRNGGGVVMVHAAQNAFLAWPEWQEMCGLLWQGKEGGDGLVIDDASGNQIRIPRGQGDGAGHGQQYECTIKVRDTNHPIMLDVPPVWKHAKDEIYHNQRGPAKNMAVLESAYDDPKFGGTGRHECITWVIPFGKGKVLTTVLCHTWRGQQNPDGVRCVGFQTIFSRSVEWVATDKVTIRVPGNFPTAEKTSVADPKDIPWSFLGMKFPTKIKPGSCCDEAKKAGKACEHPCCRAYTEQGKICPKCNGTN